MKRYSKISKITIALGTLFLIMFSYTSCIDETLNLEPVGSFSENSAFDTPEHCALSVNGVYSMSQSGFYLQTTATRGYPFGAASIIQSDMRGEDMMNVLKFFQYTYESIYTTNTGNNVAMWENSFSVICQANLAIDGVSKAGESGILSENMVKQYQGECRFLRALTYHNLLIHFCRPFSDQGNSRWGVPYIDYPLFSEADFNKALEQGRNTLDDCYSKILSDLTFAEQNLTIDRGFGYATPAGAIALKARVNLHKGDYKAVKTESMKLVPNSAPYVSPIGGHQLESDPYTPFKSYDNNKESIFSIQNAVERNSTVNGSLNQMLSSSMHGGRALVAVSPIAYTNPYWLAPGKDKRRGMLDNELKDDIDKNYPIYYTSKYSQDVASMSSWAPIVRYAEVLLNYAEAIVRDGGSITDALPLLNAVRNRSLVDLSDAYKATDFIDVKSFLSALYGERRIEFLGEGRRWEDIHRLLLDPDFSVRGIPAKISYNNLLSYQAANGSLYQVKGTLPNTIYLNPKVSIEENIIPLSDKRILWPIPTSTTSRNPTMKAQQNEGW